MRNDLQDTAQHRIDVATSAVIGHLTATLKRYGDLVVSTGAFVSSVSPRTDYASAHHAFLDYVLSLQLHQQYPSVYGVGFISRVPASQAPALDTQMKAAGQPGFNLPAPGATYACPVTYFDWTGAGSSPGAYLTADICGIGQLQDLLMQAEATGEPVVEAQVSFAGGPNHKYDFAMLDPVFPAGAAVTTPAERSAALEGWSIGLFQGSTLAAGLIPSGSPELAVRVFTGPSTNANDLVFASSNHLPSGLVQGTRRTVEEDGPWTLQIFRGPVGGLSTDLVPLAIVAAGILVTVAIFLVIGVLSRSEARSRRQVERATACLQQREALFRSIATFLPTGIMQIDRSGSCLYANPMMSHMSGRREEALLGFGWFEAIHPEDRRELRDTLGPLVGSQRELSHHSRLVTPRGRVYDASIRASALTRTDGDIEGYVVWVEDVTQQMRTRDHLQHRRWACTSRSTTSGPGSPRLPRSSDFRSTC